MAMTPCSLTNTQTQQWHGCRRLWQYAIHAVLQDLGKHWPPQRLSGESLLEWRRQRQLYTDLWRRQLQLRRQKSAPTQVPKACMWEKSTYVLWAECACMHGLCMPHQAQL